MQLFHGLGRHLDSGALDELTLTTNGSRLAFFEEYLIRFSVLPFTSQDRKYAGYRPLVGQRLK